MGRSKRGDQTVTAELDCHLPDARALASVVVADRKMALQLTYADDQELFQRIQGFSSTAAVYKFARARQAWGEELYIIWGQMHDLDHFPDTGNTLGTWVQGDTEAFILQLSGLHKVGIYLGIDKDKDCEFID